MNAAHTGRALLLAALNVAAAVQGKTLLASDFTFGAVAASTNPNREVEVELTAAPESLFSGEQTVFFDRLDVQGIFTAAGITDVTIIKGATTVGEVVDAINTRFGLGFTAEDFDLTTVVGEEDTEVVLSALPGSFAFKGDLLVSLAVAKTPLAEAVVNPELGGLEVTPVDSEAEPA
ncbi:hypothetical protein D3C87_332480 [compost metagenome]